MTAFEKILFDLLKEKGVSVVCIWYEPNFSWHPARGFYFEDAEGNEYKLGSNKAEAQANAISGKFEKLE